MDTPTKSGASSAMILIGVVAALTSAAVAAVAWSAIGYFIARTLALGLILLPLGSGGGAGLVMRWIGRGMGRHAGWVAAVATIIGCIVGDFLWTMWATQKPVGLLLGAELTMTLNTLFNLQKAVLYAVAVYLAFAIANPPRTWAS